MALEDVNTRFMSSYELRQTVIQKNNRIQALERELSMLRNDVDKLSDWNSKWQTERWDRQLINEFIKGFLKKGFTQNSSVKNKWFTENEIKILAYLCSIQGDHGNWGINKAERHVWGIARVTGISKDACRTALKRLQQKKLVRAWLHNNYKKEYFTLPEARELVKAIQSRQSPQKAMCERDSVMKTTNSMEVLVPNI